ncbi:Rab9 effector protein [Sarotherodon galilaeus]
MKKIGGPKGQVGGGQQGEFFCCFSFLFAFNTCSSSGAVSQQTLPRLHLAKSKERSGGDGFGGGRKSLLGWMR